MTVDPTRLTRTLPGPAGLADTDPQQLPSDPSLRWLVVLSRALYTRQRRFDMLDAYYKGEQDNAKLVTPAWRRAGFESVFPHLNANHSSLAVDAARDRMEVQGFRLADEDIGTDATAWRIWRANEMDGVSRQAHVEALVYGECPVLVEPDNVLDVPRITPQSPTEVIVWTAPGDRRLRQAAMKTYLDQWTGQRRFVLYLPDRVEFWTERERGRWDSWLSSRAVPVDVSALVPWEQDGGTPAVLTNPLGEVPVVTLPNDPRLAGSPEAEHEVVIPLIDAYTKGLMDMMVASHELAFPQRYMTGVDEEDEQAVLDQYGNVLAEAPVRIRTGPGSALVLRDPEGKVGQLAAADLAGYVRQLDQLRGEIATISFRPYHYMLNMPSSVPPSGESITAAEAPFADNVHGHTIDKGIGWRNVMRLCFKLQGDDARARAMAMGEVLWRDPERHTESQHVDALGKEVSLLKLPIEAAWEQLPQGSPQAIDRWKRLRAGQPADTDQDQAAPAAELTSSEG